MIVCVDCGCTKEEALTKPFQYCVSDNGHHRFRSTEERTSIGHKHKERIRP